MAGKLRCRIRFIVVGKITAALLGVAVFGQDLSQQASEAMRTGRYADAERLYRQLVKQFPSEAGWHGNLGLALHSQKRYREAITPLEQSLKLRPSAGLFAVLGIDYLKINEPCKAIVPLEKTDQEAALADAYSECRRFPEAAKLYERLGQPRAAARAYWEARDYDKAEPLFARIADQYRGDSGFAYEYGDTLLRAKGAAAALPYLEQATSLSEGRGALGKAYSELNRFAEAIPHLEAAVSVDPDLYLPLSRAYKATGRAADAERALNHYKKRQNQN